MKTAVRVTFKDNPWPFCSFPKNTRQEANVLSPLKTEDGFLNSDSTCKANIRNDLFVSVFTKIDTSSLPDRGPNMANIEVKLLKGLKPFKATRPDSIPAFILKTAAAELALILARIYQIS